MATTPPGLMRLIRAPFLSSIISPLISGSLLAAYITGQFDFINFVLVLLIGICLHSATNVYNDIYDTLQGTDKVNLNRNEFSGGSGVLIEHPHLLGKMKNIARSALVIGAILTILMYLRIEGELRFILIGLYLLSAFFSKYYTAAPVKLAYRGWGEISVWFAFGPMAIMIAAVSQHVGFHPTIIAAMPITGISTLSILLIGQMIDLDADRETGKWGIAVRLGNRAAAILYTIVQLALCLNILLLSGAFIVPGWPLLLSLIPYLLIFPRTAITVLRKYNDTSSLKSAARSNVSIHLLFSALLIIGFLLVLI